MNNPNFTKGPWKVADDVLFNVRSIRIRAADYPWILAKVADTTQELMLKAAKQDMDWNVFAANAQLMASAPEMYDLLQKIMLEAYETLDESGEEIIALPDGVISSIASILRKARGEK